MLRFYIFGSVTTEERNLNAAYAFCVEDRLERVYWGRGWSTDSVVAAREAGSRIMDAVLMTGSDHKLEFITTATELDTRAKEAWGRFAQRQAGKSIPQVNDEERWLRFAQQFRTLKVEVQKPTVIGNEDIFRSVQKVARMRRAMPDGAKRDPSFSECDDFDLVGDLKILISSSPSA